MRKKLVSLLLILFVIMVSIFVTILPTFYTKGVSRISLKQDFNLDYVLDAQADTELVFFGYAGCRDICTPRLEELGKWYASLPKQTQDRLGLKFFDLSIPQDKTLPDSFAKAFHKDFQGVYLADNIIRVYTKAFSVYFSKSLMDDAQIDHTSHLYLVKRDKEGKRLRFIYTAFPYNFKQIQFDIEELIHE